MAVVEELIRVEADGTISFGNHRLAEKAKLDGFEHAGDILKVKTFHEMTKLEKNGLFLYESVPGTSVLNFAEKEDGVEFVHLPEEEQKIVRLENVRNVLFQTLLLDNVAVENGLFHAQMCTVMLLK